MSEAREDAARRLWGLWRQGRRPDLADFLAGAGPLSPLDLAAVLRVDQRERWLTGERLPAECYLRAHPHLAADEEAALDVVYSEYILRQDQGEEVAPQEFLRRFPQFEGQLRLQLDFGQALADRDAPPPPTNAWTQAVDPRFPGAAAAPDDPIKTKAGFQPPPSKGPQADGPRLPSPEEPRTLPRGALASSLPADAQQKIEEICNRFESAWVKGLRPRIEEFLTEIEAPRRPALLRELLPLDVGYRRAQGEAPTTVEYLARFPSLEPAWLAEAVASPAAGGSPGGPPDGCPGLRRPRAHRVRCPHCHSPIQLIDERPQEVLCPGCGSSFRMQEANNTASAPAMRLGKFQLLERVGRGAFGAVWRALDLELERVVALKIPHAGLTISSPELQLFLDEARKAAKLRHPGIVNIHEVTTLQGMPVIVSDFINGATLKDLLEVRRPTFRQTARLIAEVADAVHHAHVNGLVHRDLKPANIMVERGEETVGPDGLGRPLVLDFGLALREEAQITMTVAGEIIGTPAYINPEQAAGRGHYADRRSDVFSLGVVFYEMLCGELPFRGSRMMLLDQVQHDDPRLPRRINERIPRDLETICLKAMAKLPAKRYQTADEFAADLRRFLAGEPIHARRAGRMERLWRWCRRRPRDAALAAALFGLLLLLALGSAASALWIERERSRAESHLGQTLEALDLLSAAAQDVTDEAPQMEGRQRELLEKALALRQTILEEEPSAVSRAKLGQAYHQMGRILKNFGDADRAKEDFTRAIAEFEGLAASGDPDAWHNAALNHNDLAEVLRATSPADAPEHYEKALRIQEGLRAAYPNRDAYVKELARTCNNYGILLAHRLLPADSRTRAKEKYDEAIRLMRPLADDSRPDFQSDLAQELINRGECQGSGPEAIRDYTEAVRLLQALRTNNPGKHDDGFRLGVANEDLGMALADQKQFKEAEAADREALDQFARLADEFPKTPLYRKDLANTWDNLGATFFRETPPDRAREPWQKAQALFQQLITDQPDVLEYKSKAAENLHNLGLLSLACDNKPATAEPLLARAIALESEAWEKSDRQNPEYLRLLCGHHYLHAHSLADQGAYVAAAAEAESLYALAACEDDPTRTISTFDAAGVLSLCAAGAETDPKLNEERRRERGQRYAGRALEWLREVSEKARSAKGIKSTVYDGDADFNSVRARAGFQKLREDWQRREKEPS